MEDYFKYIIKIKEKIQKIKSENHLSLKSEIKEIRLYRDPLDRISIGVELTLMNKATSQMLRAWAKAEKIVFIDTCINENKESLEINENGDKYINLNLI